MSEHVVTSVLRNLLSQAEAQLDKPKTPIEKKAAQLLALAARGDRAGMDQLIRSWPESEARQVVAALEGR